AVPDLVVALLEPDACDLAIAVDLVEETEFDAGRVLREQGEVHPGSVPRRPQRIGCPRPDLDAQRRTECRSPRSLASPGLRPRHGRVQSCRPGPISNRRHDGCFTQEPSLATTTGARCRGAHPCDSL